MYEYQLYVGERQTCLSILTQPNTLKMQKLLKRTDLYESQISKHVQTNMFVEQYMDDRTLHCQ